MSFSPPNTGNNNVEKCCAVCEQPNARNNFGTLSCNACAAFFRRTLIQGRRYVCNCGLSNEAANISCSAQKNVRECKFCRFEKCVQAGMQEKSIRSMEVWKWRSDMSKLKGITKNSHSHKAKCLEKNKQNPVEIDELDDEPEDIKDIKPVLPLATPTPFITKIILPDDLFEASLLSDLLFAEQKIFRVQNSRTSISDDVIQKISQMKWHEIVEMQDNLLAKAEQFDLEAQPCFDQQILDRQKQLQEKGVWFDVFVEEQSVWFELYIRDLMTSIGFVKTLPFFRKLDFQDQCVLLCSQTLPLVDLCVGFDSMLLGAKVITLVFK